MKESENRFETATDAFEAEDKDIQIRYPDDLVAVWQYVHADPECPLHENEFAKKWNGLCQILMGVPLPRGNTKDRRLNSARDFLVSLVKEIQKPSITTQNALIARYRSYFARKNNPAGHELSQILNGALHDLVKAGKVRTNATRNLYSANALFVLAGLKDPKQRHMTDYRENMSMVSRYTTKCRGGDWEKTGLLAPSDAQKLCLELLAAFGGWVTNRELLSAMQNHIPEQFREGPMPESSEKDGTQFDPKDPQGGGMSAFKEEQARCMGYEFAESIWAKICKNYTNTFCLYYLPKYYYRKNITQDVAGPTSTVSDHCGKIGTIFQECLGEYVTGRDDGWNSSVRMTMSVICENLSGRCSEKGYPSDLYVCRDNN